MGTNKLIRLLGWVLFAWFLFSIFNQMDGKKASYTVTNYSAFVNTVKTGRVEWVRIEEHPDGKTIEYSTGEEDLWKVNGPTDDPGLYGDLLNHNVKFTIKTPYRPSFLMNLFMNWGPTILFIGVIFYFMRRMGPMGGAGSGGHVFGKSKARMLSEEENKTRLHHVAGIEEAKEEVAEVIDFLKNPGKFEKLGGRVPRGILMTGAPGTGKTLLARAIAGEAKVPFFTISGSDFVEMFVGVGAARVRDMFTLAKKNAPCIIFIDEIDAVGRQRGAGLGGGHDEREQTLNALLVEMDGFEGNPGVVVIAATNRPDVLDPALLRPGRFDRRVVVPLPDINGREQILKVHIRKNKVPLGDVNLRTIARSIPGFSGADLEQLINEAAIFAARRNKDKVEMDEFEAATDKIIMGAERKSIVMDEEELKNTAYHECGHTLVAKKLELADPVHKVTIIPRGRALGVTMQLPEKDVYGHSKEWLKTRIAVLMGGRIAEEIFMDQMTTGASNDFEQATNIARSMVTRWGMSDKLGNVIYAEQEQNTFLGRDINTRKSLSDATAELVDLEIKSIIDEQYKRARDLIEGHKKIMEEMTKQLLEWETLNSDQLNDIISGKKIKAPAG